MEFLRCIVVGKLNKVSSKWVPESTISFVEDNVMFVHPTDPTVMGPALKIWVNNSDYGEFYVMKDDIEVKHITAFKQNRVKIKDRDGIKQSDLKKLIESRSN